MRAWAFVSCNLEVCRLAGHHLSILCSFYCGRTDECSFHFKYTSSQNHNYFKRVQASVASTEMSSRVALDGFMLLLNKPIKLLNQFIAVVKGEHIKGK